MTFNAPSRTVHDPQHTLRTVHDPQLTFKDCTLCRTFQAFSRTVELSMTRL